jgi:CheY-like chemotaxis protein
MSRRVLLVDDDDSIREIAQLSLERVGDWEVVAVASGQEAVEAALARGPFSLVLLDVMMPGLDGPTTMARLRQGPLPAEVPVVFLTAKLQPADRERLRKLGAAGVIAKPFDPMALAAELDEILGDER